MKTMLLKMLVPMLLNAVEEMMTKENFQKYGSKLFGILKEFIVDTETKMDDRLLPLIEKIEGMLGLDLE